MATDGYVGARLDMLLQHELIVHFARIAGNQLNEAGALTLDDVDILIDGVRDRPIECYPALLRCDSIIECLRG